MVSGLLCVSAAALVCVVSRILAFGLSKRFLYGLLSPLSSFFYCFKTSSVDFLNILLILCMPYTLMGSMFVR
jgi:hypothetical protein